MKAFDETTELDIEVTKEEDGLWLAECAALPGWLARGRTREEALEMMRSICLRRVDLVPVS